VSATGLLYYNEAFRGISPEFGSSMTATEAMTFRQFRLKNIYAEPPAASKPAAAAAASAAAATAAEAAPRPPKGELLLMLEHEVRGPSHVANPLLRRGAAAAAAAAPVTGTMTSSGGSMADGARRSAAL
jgi:hypothetical protein